MKSKFKIISYGKLKEMEKIPLSISNPKNEFAALNEKYLNLYNYHKDDAPVAYLDGDLNINGNLDLDELFYELFVGHEESYNFPDKGYAYTAIAVIWISGELNVSNTIISKECENMSNILVVEKDVTTNSIIEGGVELFFLNDLDIKQISYTRLCAEAGKIVFGEQNIYIDTDINNYWKIRNNEPFELDEDTSSNILNKIFNDTSKYFEFWHDEDNDIQYYYETNEEKLIHDIQNNKNIFCKNIDLGK